MDVEFTSGGNPLEKHRTWKFVDCPKCGKQAERETDTFDTFFESSWYFAVKINRLIKILVIVLCLLIIT